MNIWKKKWMSVSKIFLWIFYHWNLYAIEKYVKIIHFYPKPKYPDEVKFNLTSLPPNQIFGNPQTLRTKFDFSFQHAETQSCLTIAKFEKGICGIWKRFVKINITQNETGCHGNSQWIQCLGTLLKGSTE